MKKLLVATSALVAAGGSAQALDVTLGGEISITSDIALDNSGFVGGGNWGAGFTIKAHGESMGWTYGGTLELGIHKGLQLANQAQTAAVATLGQVAVNDMDLQLKDATVYMGGDFMGRISIQDSCGNFVEVDKVDEQVGNIDGDHCIQWSGLKFNGFEVMAALAMDEVDSSQSGFIIGAKGDVMGLSFGTEIDLNDEAIDATIDADLGGFTLGLDMSYDDGDADEFDYAVSVGSKLGDFGIKLEYSPENRLGSGAAYTAVAGTSANAVGAASADGTPLTNLAIDTAKDIMLELSYGSCWKFDAGIAPVDNNIFAYTDADGSGTVSTGDTALTGDMDGLYMWDIKYECDLHDGVKIKAALGQSEVAATNSLSGITGSVGATITF